MKYVWMKWLDGWDLLQNNMGQVFGDECKRIDWSWNVNYWSWVFDRWGIIIIYIFAYVWHFPKQGLKKKSEGKSWDQSMKKNICWIWTGSRNFCKKVSNSHEEIHGFLGKITIKIKTTKKTQEAGNLNIRVYIACNRKLKPIKSRINSPSSISLR